MPLQHIYRPKTIDEMFGNKTVKQSFEAVMSREQDIPHSFLITGPSGTGKTTLARIIKSKLDCDDFDFKEMNSSDDRGIDAIRTLINQSKIQSMFGAKALYLLDESHQITSDAQESLLKLLEDPPGHVYIALCTTDPQKLKKTLKRRCHEFELKPLNTVEMKHFLKHLIAGEGIKDYPDNVIERIAFISEGSPGIAAKYLDAVIDIENDNDALEYLKDFSLDEDKKVIDLCQAVSYKKQSWAEVSKILKEIDENPESVRRAILNYLSKILLNKGGDNIAEVMLQFADNLYDTGKAGLILQTYFAYKSKG